MLKLKKIYKLLLIIALLFILTTEAYASVQPSETQSSNLTDLMSSEGVNRIDSDSSRRESSLVGENETKICLACNDTGIITKTITNYLTCPVCTAGKVSCHSCDGLGYLGSSKHIGKEICPECLGTGLQTCPDCNGKGYKSEITTSQANCPICKDKTTK